MQFLFEQWINWCLKEIASLIFHKKAFFFHIDSAFSGRIDRNLFNFFLNLIICKLLDV